MSHINFRSRFWPRKPKPDQKPSGSGVDNPVSIPPETENLWELAFWTLEQDLKSQKHLIAYEKALNKDQASNIKFALLRSSPLVGTKAERQEQVKAWVQLKAKEAEDARLKFSINNHDIEIAGVVDKVIGAIIWGKDRIGGVLPADPYVGAVWAGICVLLPVGRFSGAPSEPPYGLPDASEPCWG
jgi:hypothetical protein